MQNLNLGVIPSYAFTDLTCRNVYFQSSSITDIKKHAFNNFRVNEYFYLHSNQLTTISSSIFGGTSNVEYLQMYSNGITSITSDGFRNVDVDYIYLQNNGLTVYPIALNDITPIQIHLYNNEISIIPTGSFDSQTRLQLLYMYDNNITQISAGLLTPATSLLTIDFHDNQIQYIEEGSFNGLLSLQTLNLGENVIPYFPSVILPAIRTLNLADNRIEALGGLNLGGSLTSVNLDNNFLGCECSTVESLYNVKDDLSANTMCYSPTAIQGVLFASSQSSSPDHFTNKDVALFQCSGENIIGSPVSSTNITITWDRPSYLYSLVNASHAETVKAETVTNNIETWEYLVTCTSNTAATLTKIQTVVLDFSECIIVTPCNTTTDNTTVTSSNSTAANTTVLTDCNTIDPNCTKSTDHTTSVSFSDVDGLLPQTLYECVIQLTVDNYTSAKSVPTFIYAPAVITVGNETTDNNVTTNTKDINMDMTFYDFSAGHDDFSSTSGILSVSPYHVTSPLGSWLAFSSDPSVDTFSEWFRSVSSNVVVQGGITLSYDDTVTTSVVRRYYSGSFFPVDNSGYGAEGQTDCGGTLHNFAFTSALRSGITFSGSEVITVGGGEELWLFINKILVVEIIKNRTTSDIPCQKIDLSATNGGGNVIPEEGVIVNGDCVGLSPLTSATVYLELEVAETYQFEIFHAERQTCTSELFIQFENVDLPENGSLPFDYHLTPREDLHVNGIVGIFNIWDIFATGPSFQVELSGNEARHFTLKEDTIANRNAATTVTPPTYEYVLVKGTNFSYAECAPEVLIPEPSTPGSEMFTISTSEVLLTLVTGLDYEVEQTYTIKLRVADTGSGLTGSLVIRVSIQDVNDNCPSLTSISYITPRPILQLEHLFNVQSNDSDSGINAEIQIYISPVIYESPPVDYNYISDIRREVYNGSTELTLEIIGIDQGTPPRGSAVNVTVNISNTCLIDELLDRTNMLFTVNQSSGDVYLRIPGYWVINYTCSDYIGVYNGLIRDDQMTASSSRSKLTLPDRARLENNASDPVFGPLAGGWVAGTNDLDQYIEVNMEEFYQIKQINLQGQQDEANWVTAFRVYYVDNTTGNWTLYKNDAGEFIFLGNNDQDTIRTTDLVPPIVSQYIRINPRNWTNNIGLRMELSGCPLALQYYYDTSCERCYTSSYCLGDGETHMCGRCENGTDPCDRSPTEHSFGAQSECSPCLDGWICKDGYATPCANYTYVLGCNDTYCPDTCTHCEAGYACRGGQRYICLPGTYSKGSVEFCTICTEGLYQDEPGQSECKKCPAGYYSSKSKDRCNACDVGSYSLGDGKVGCIACTSTTECPCMGNKACFEAGDSRAGCINKGSGSYECLDCPVGFIGDGVTCADIDECALHHPCWNTSACINTVPGYQCLACPYGYTGTYEDGLAWNNTVRVFELMNQELAPLQEQICVDINECLTDNGRCDPLSPCVNTIGSYYCGFCAEGYAGIPSINCYSSNYCQTGQHTCSEFATCIYLGPGEYSCECDIGYTGTGIYCGLDSDLDGHPDKTLPCTDWGCYRDNCRLKPNCGQEDADGDRIGDDCDSDSDNDGTIDPLDNCPYVHSWDRTDSDNDTVGDVCDNCPSISNTDQIDTDKNGVGDACDTDDDNDGISDVTDNCPLKNNPTQLDSDSDNVGDICDNCISIGNTAQTDTDQNGFGDSCDPTINKDRDGDSVLDISDNCQEAANGEQTDTDGDGIGDVCDPDLDDDGINNSDDNCPYLHNPLQTDVNGDQVGDDCVVDSDGDGVDDSNDTCPYNRYISTTSFSDYFSVDLYPGYSIDPQWRVKAVGREIYQLADTGKPVMLIGQQTYGSMKYSGTVYVPSDKGDNYIGIVFGYVNNRKFYLLSWKPTNYNFETTTFQTGVKGLNLKVVNSNTGPGQTLAYALWHSSTTVNQDTVLWHDGNMTRWSNYTSYKWFLWHYTDLNKIRFQLYDVNSLLADSGDIYDTSITGGRVGVYQFGQESVLWSDLKVQCLPRENKALYLDGVDDYIVLTNITRLDIYQSFSIGLWIKIDSLAAGDMPLFCTDTRTICLWLDAGFVHGSYGNNTVTSTSTINTNEWISLLYIYDESEYSMTLYVNGNSAGVTSDVAPNDLTQYTTDEDTLFFMGKDANNFFKGYVDEFVFYNVALLGTEINDHIHLPSITKYPTYHRYGQLYYKMDQTPGTLYLKDEGLLEVPGQISGSPIFGHSLQDYNRFNLEYPDN
ncbi:uncharacterized protein LOC127706896 isoform X1 [Mytilus californianus]|uniref:uncharacterized protein LOC127706896 isoform X1 n=1 Tax=Mytilus californianus TaxID=6549 RepID=UPI0022476489|nr:uncharacterized protein LOC127706896 isoform X1 [Mytilus californianus]